MKEARKVAMWLSKERILRSAYAKALRQDTLRRDSKKTNVPKVELVTNNKYTQLFPSKGMEAY